MSRRAVIVITVVMGLVPCAVGWVALKARGGSATAAAQLARAVDSSAVAEQAEESSPSAMADEPDNADAAECGHHSPMQLCLSPDGRHAYVINETAGSVSVLDVADRRVLSEFPVGRRPVHGVVSADGRILYIACQLDHAVHVVDVATATVVGRWQTGYEPLGLALTADGQHLAVANSLANTVSLFSVPSGELVQEVPVGHAPRYLAATPDGRRLVVGNSHSRDISIIGVESARVLETRALGRSAQLQHVLCTADGRYAVVAGLVAHDEMITVQMERGWILSNGLYIVELDRPDHSVTLLLDQLLSGAANPWALAVSADQRRLYVSLAGIHQVAMVDLPAALELVAHTRREQVPRLSQDVEILERLKIARRVDAGGVGPRALALHEARNELLVANYFSDAVAVLDAESGAVKATIPLGAPPKTTLWRKGHALFNDARICYQNWYSCASCHQDDGTTDSLNWDLLNDGTGNPKNVKSLHEGMYTPPAMWSGVRGDQSTGVMAGQRFLGFLPDAEVQTALMEFIGKPRRAPNPYRAAQPEAIERGRNIFFRARCDACHPSPLFTDLKQHDIGLSGPSSEADFRSRFDTPSLRECYRTAPYLHDGRAATLREVLTVYNPRNEHGLTRGLAPADLEDLMAYLRSL